MKVADRVRRIELAEAVPRQDGPHALLPIQQGLHHSHFPSSPQLVFPLHIQRFQRRDADGAIVRPETPYNNSRPAEDLAMHAPQPVRKVPNIDNTVNLVPLPNSPAAEYAIQSELPGSELPSMAAVPGTIHNCARHGRKPLKTPTSPRPTLNGMVRSISGTYIPVGLSSPTQAGTTSPRAIGTPSADDKAVCPNCAAEQAIRRREEVEQKQQKLTRQKSIVVTRTLPARIGAIIIEQNGQVNQVVTNMTEGPTAAELLSIIDQVAADLRLDLGRM